MMFSRPFFNIYFTFAKSAGRGSTANIERNSHNNEKK